MCHWKDLRLGSENDENLQKDQIIRHSLPRSFKSKFKKYNKLVFIIGTEEQTFMFGTYFSVFPSKTIIYTFFFHFFNMLDLE